MMIKNAKVFLYFVSGLVLGSLLIMVLASKKNETGATAIEVNKDGRPLYKWYTPVMPDKLDFCGEEMPLNQWDVRERMERELLSNYYLRGSELYILKLAGRYFPIIEERLKANNMPDDLKYICVAESSLQQNVLSPVGAASFWQFMKETGPNFGLEINEEVDQRFNVVKATDAACKYLKQLHDKFGSWTSAAAAYNCGQGSFSNQVEFQQATNYYDLIFPEETNRYVFRIVALKYLLSNAKSLGVILEPSEEYKPLKYRTITVEKTVDNLTEFAKANNTSYKMLKIYNPWLRAHKLTVKPGKKYEIALPL